MSTIQASLYLVAAALCVFSTSLTTRARLGKRLTFFTGFLLIQAVTFALELLMAHPSTPLKSLWPALRDLPRVHSLGRLGALIMPGSRVRSDQTSPEQ